MDFASCHVYGGGSDENSVGSISSVVGPLPTTQHDAAGLPLVITEWSSSWMYTIDYHDEPASAPFIVGTVAAMDGLLNISSYWVFSDVFEEGGILPLPFHGGFGLLTINGTPKPAYRAFQLLHGAGDERHAVTTDTANGKQCDVTVLSTSNGTSARVFVANHPLISSDPGVDCSVSITFANQKLASSTAQMCKIDANTSNPKAAWQQMGSPVYPTDEQLVKLEAASALVWTTVALTETAPDEHGAKLAVAPNSLVVLDISIHV